VHDDAWWNPDDPLLYGRDRAHDLRDVFRDLLDPDPDQSDAPAAECRDGPVAVAHEWRTVVLDDAGHVTIVTRPDDARLVAAEILEIHAATR
jgi:hypothetical protein